MLCLGLLPSKSDLTSFNVLYTAILNRMEADNCFQGFSVYDAFLRKHRIIQVQFCIWIEDLKGLPMVLCCRTTGGKVGVCPWCEVTGISMCGSCRYFTAIMLLPDGHELRDLFEVEFGGHTGIYIFDIRAFVRAVRVLHSYCIRTVFVLYSYFIRTLFALKIDSYCIRTVFVLYSYFIRTLFVLYSYFIRTSFIS